MKESKDILAGNSANFLGEQIEGKATIINKRNHQMKERQEHPEQTIKTNKIQPIQKPIKMQAYRNSPDKL
ncbi:hypothetical protein [Caldifermentibacillus hisashii]|uniref:hypothetical protein n=1 Tax=Caldifermentibacillus hisashii TaxID=996558 RepID=UPI003D1D2F0D